MHEPSFHKLLFSIIQKSGRERAKNSSTSAANRFFFRVNAVGYYYHIFVAFLIITKYTQAINKQEKFWKGTDVDDNFMFSYKLK